MSSSCWEILGLEPTNDERAIKRAYAVRLKSVDVDAQPREFQELREAYETALAHRTYWDEAQQPAAVGAGAHSADGDPFTDHPQWLQEQTVRQRLGRVRPEFDSAREMMRRLKLTGEGAALSYVKDTLASPEYDAADAREAFSRIAAPALVKLDERPMRLIRHLAGRLEWVRRPLDLYSETGGAIEALLREIPHIAEHEERAAERAHAPASSNASLGTAAAHHGSGTREEPKRNWWLYVFVALLASSGIRICLKEQQRNSFVTPPLKTEELHSRAQEIENHSANKNATVS